MPLDYDRLKDNIAHLNPHMCEESYLGEIETLGVCHKVCLWS